MRAWVLVSCSSLFMSAAYAAFHYDATVRNKPNLYSLNQHLQEITIVLDSFEFLRIDITSSKKYQINESIY